MFLNSLALFLVLQGAIQSSTAASDPFHPGNYAKQTATCKALRRTDEVVVDIQMRYVEVNPEAKTTLLMVHGWPSLWSSWSNQIQEFGAYYHLIVPDLRGFGESTHPGDAKPSGTMGDMVGDLVCVLESARIDSAICVGHDWGTQVCYEAARMRPDIFKAVAGITIPYIPSAGHYTPVKDLVDVLPKLNYQLFFDQQTAAAAAQLNEDVRRSLRGTLRTVDSPPPDTFLTSSDTFMGAYSDLEEIPPIPFFTEEEEDYFVEQYKIQGFQNTLEFYIDENRFTSWQFAHEQGNHTIYCPVLSILPSDDPVANWVLAARILKSADFLPQLTTEVLPGAHWVHMEHPQEVNAILRKWLTQLLLEDGRHDEL